MATKQDSTINCPVTLNAVDLYGVLYRVPHELRDETFDRIANAVDHAIHGEDPLCECGTYLSEHGTYGCESFKAVQR